MTKSKKTTKAAKKTAKKSKKIIMDSAEAFKEAAAAKETLEKKYAATIEHKTLDVAAPKEKSLHIPRGKKAKKDDGVARTAEDLVIIDKEEKKMSGLDAAAKVLTEAGEPLNTKTMVERAIEKGYWTTGGKTPAATIYAAILREITVKGDAARFEKTDRGMFKIRA